MPRSKKEITIEREYWRDAVDVLREDVDHGSMYIAEEGLKIIEEYIGRQLYKNRTELIQNLAKLSNALVRAKPLMALIYNRAHRILNFIQSLPKDERDISAIKNLVIDEIKLIRKQTAERQAKIIRLGARLILDQHTVLTHSSSQIVESILLEAKRLKKRFRLICTESRPRLEGKQLARRMAKAGIKTTLIPDADISRAVGEAHFVITGTDRITENSFVNKTGTTAIAFATKENNKPFYIAADSDKILRKRVYPLRFHSINEKELLEKSAANLTIENIYSEETALSFLHKLICEAGIFEREEFIERFLI